MISECKSEAVAFRPVYRTVLMFVVRTCCMLRLGQFVVSLKTLIQIAQIVSICLPNLGRPCNTVTDLASTRNLLTRHTQLLRFERLFSCYTRASVSHIPYSSCLSVCLSVARNRRYVTQSISSKCSKFFLAGIMQCLVLCCKVSQRIRL